MSFTSSVLEAFFVRFANDLILAPLATIQVREQLDTIVNKSTILSFIPKVSFLVALKRIIQEKGFIVGSKTILSLRLFFKRILIHGAKTGSSNVIELGITWYVLPFYVTGPLHILKDFLVELTFFPLETDILTDHSKALLELNLKDEETSTNVSDTEGTETTEDKETLRKQKQAQLRAKFFEEATIKQEQCIDLIFLTPIVNRSVHSLAAFSAKNLDLVPGLFAFVTANPYLKWVLDRPNFIGNVVATAFSYPFNTVKKRLQVLPVDKNRSASGVSQEILEKQGPLALFSGLETTLVIILLTELIKPRVAKFYEDHLVPFVVNLAGRAVPSLMATVD